VLFIPWRIRIVARGDRVFAANASVHTFDGELAATLLLEHVLGLLGGCSLGVVDPRRPGCAVALVAQLPSGLWYTVRSVALVTVRLRS
jgi:hypothetical protein